MGINCVDKTSNYYSNSQNDLYKTEVKRNGLKSFQTQVEKADSAKLTKEQEMELFKQKFYEEINQIPKSRYVKSLFVHITDQGWERMKADSKYRDQMLSLIKRDATGFSFDRTNRFITVGATADEYRAESWGSSNDSFEERIRRNRQIQKKKKKKKELKEYYEELLRHRDFEKKVLKEKMFNENIVKEKIERSEEESLKNKMNALSKIDNY